MRLLPYILLLVLALTACKDSTRFVQRLDDIDSLVDVDPDSAYRRLVGMQEEAREQRKSLRMRYELALANAQNKAYVNFTTDSVMKQVVEYYEDNGTPNQQMHANYLLGCTYRDLGDAPTELEYFQKAVESADTAAEDCDFYTLAAVYGQMADIYDDQYLPEEELAALKECEISARKGNDKITEIAAYALRIRPYYYLKNKDSVIIITENAYQMYLRYGKREKAARLLPPAISILIDRDDYKNAKKYMDIYEMESGYFSGTKDIDKAKYYFHDKGRFFLHTNQLDSAIVCCDLLLREGEKEAAYNLLMLLHTKQNNSDSVSKYAQLYAMANDSCYIGKSTETIARMSRMYNYGRMKNESEQAATLLLTAHKTVEYMLIITLLLIILLAIVYRIYIKNKKQSIQRIITLSYKLEDATQKYKELRDRYNQEEIKHNDILANYEQRGLMLEALNEEIEQLKNQLEQESVENLQESFYQTDIYKVFRSSGYNGKTTITEVEWDDLVNKFENHFIRFSNFLNSHAVSADQYRVAALIRLGFKESDISNIMCKTSARINRIKIQLNTKLFEKTDAKTLRENLKRHF